MRVSHIVVLALLAFGTLAAAPKKHKIFLTDPQPTVVPLLTGRRKVFSPPFFVGRPYQSYPDAGIESAESVKQIGEFYLEQGKDFQSITEEGRKQAAKYIQNLTYVGGFAVVIRTKNVSRSAAALDELKKRLLDVKIPLLSGGEIASISADLEKCVAEQGWLVYQLYPYSDEDHFIRASQDFQVQFRRNFLYAACGSEKLLEVAVASATYAANRVPSDLKIYHDVDPILREYVLTSIAQSLSGQCANPSFLGDYKRLLIHVDPIHPPLLTGRHNVTATFEPAGSDDDADAGADADADAK
jgi:hypothetical protein